MARPPRSRAAVEADLRDIPRLRAENPAAAKPIRSRADRLLDELLPSVPAEVRARWSAWADNLTGGAVTAPARPLCTHCNTVPITRRVTPTTPGSHTVDLSLCDCDYLHCPHAGCKKVIRTINVPLTCPHCNGRL